MHNQDSFLSRFFVPGILALLISAPQPLRAEDKATFQSCPPMRDLPLPSGTPMDRASPARFVDPVRGQNTNRGDEKTPWRTLGHAIAQLRPGETLYLRGGIYYERISVNNSGTVDRPITIRSYPGELAIIDGGFHEFIERPEKCWESVPGGQHDEYRSTATYPELAEDIPTSSWHQNNPEHPRLHLGPQPNPTPGQGVIRGIYGSGYFSSVVKVLGNFADSMVPLHGYYNRADLPADDEQVKRRAEEDHGPGVWFDQKTQRIHIRLNPTKLPHLGKLNYQGESDPRKLPLVIGGARVVVHIEGCKHLRLCDLVVRGTRSRTVNIENSTDIRLDHVTLYGGAPALHIQSTVGFQLRHSALRGTCAPWSSRSSEKYHGNSSYLFIADGSPPLNRNVEIANCELTDNHDGLILGSIDGLHFHHNHVDNFNDDGLYLTTDMPAGSNLHIYQNHLSRSLSMLAYAGKGADQQGKEVYFYRNVFDLRAGLNSLTGWTPSRICGDHGSPIWKPMRFYHNTVLQPETPWRNYYGAGLAKSLKGTSRTYLNNIFYFTKGRPGFAFDLQGEQLADGNLHWSPEVPENERADVLTRARTPMGKQPRWFEESKKTYAPGWTAHDVFADPRFVQPVPDEGGKLDLRLRSGSPAIDAGVPIPREWSDPLRSGDGKAPDLGAFPVGVESWRIGINGRLTATGTHVKRP